MRPINAYLWLALVCLTPSLQAQLTLPSGTNAPTRILSREECIRLALEHNLNIKIARRDTLIAHYNLKGSYGYYEPVLSFGAEHRYNKDDRTQDSSSETVSTNYSKNISYDANWLRYTTNTTTLLETNRAFGRDDILNRTRSDSLVSANSGITARTPFGTVLEIGALYRGIDQDNMLSSHNGNFRNSKQDTSIMAPDSPLTIGVPDPVDTTFPSFYPGRSNDVVASTFEDVDTWDSSVGLTLTQPLLRDFWTDSSRTQIQVNKRDLKISEFSYEQQVMNIVSSVQSVYFDLVAQRDIVKVAEKSLELAQQLLDETKKKVAVGVATPLDEQQVESQVAARTADLMDARRLLSETENQLKQLITDDYGTWYNTVPMPSEQLLAVPESLNLNESWLMGISLRPKYNSMRVELEKQGLYIRYLKNQLYPRLDFVGFIGQSTLNRDNNSFTRQTTTGYSSGELSSDVGASSSSQGSFSKTDSWQPEYSVGLRFEMPLGGNIRDRNGLKARKEQQQQLQDQLRLLHMNILVEIEDNVREVRVRYDTVQSRRQARAYAETALEAQQKLMQNGKSTPFFVLDFQQQLTDARAQEISALANYNKALVRLYRSEGTTLERNNISLDYR